MPKAYLTKETNDIKGAMFNAEPLIREAILLEIPMYQECEGNCPSRALFEKYIKDCPAEED